MPMASSRSYTHPHDLARVLTFHAIARPGERIDEYPGATDLEELLSEPGNQRNTRLWFDKTGQLCAYAILSEDTLLFDSLEGQPTSYEEHILQWAIESLDPAQFDSLWTTCRDDNSTRINFLQAHGFQLQPDAALHYARSLQQPIPQPSLPPGFSIRPLHGEAEAPAAAELHRAAFGTGYMTTENRLNMMRTSDYDPTLDLLAIAPDGRLAAYCMVAIHAAENQRTGRKEGHTDPLATHPQFQRMGLARALLLTGLRLLQKRGIQTARLGTDSENIAMQKTAESLGFTLIHKNLRFKKTRP